MCNRMKTKTCLFSLIITPLLFILAFSCKKDEAPSKLNPVITWSNPADISFVVPLSALQLNATADVPGIFRYSPPKGTILSVGANQELKVDFKPADSITYKSISKTVRINILTLNTVTDIDGNVYNEIVIGNQVWMGANLKVTRFNDGTQIPLIIDNNTWLNLTTPAYCWYNNDSINNKNIYGGMYNWYAVNTGKLAPAGWHVPTDAEWKVLTTYLGGEYFAGSKLRETGMSHWPNNSGATNEVGFTALPGGNRGYGDGVFFYLDYFGDWWTSSEFPGNGAWTRRTNGYEYNLYRGFIDCYMGLSVRCIKD
jgi:uncharacterized protein (TIGR02145 family)